MKNYLKPSTTYQHRIIEKILMRVFNEEFLAERSKNDQGPIKDMVNRQDWLSLKQTNPIFHKIRRDLSVTPTGCLLFDNRLVIPTKLRPLVLQTIHSKHPGQAGMLALARLIWYPHMHTKSSHKHKAAATASIKVKT